MRRVSPRVRLALSGALVLVLQAGAWTAASAADKVRISDLVDVQLGQLAMNGMDVRSSQNICLYSGSRTGSYSVSASTGTGAQFELQSPSGNLPFEVQWADSANRTSGQQLVAGTARSGFVSTANNHSCNNSPAAASLIVLLRAFEIERATAGSYSGQLTLIIAPM